MKTKTVPHPIPYQGSKRNLAADILRYFPPRFTTLIEPFAGSAAMTIAAAVNGSGERYHINDLNKPLMDLWRAIIESPEEIAAQYAALWREQLCDPRAYYDVVRDDFNRTGKPDLFLYLLARCVKGSVRYNAQGEFNQSPDNRRQGMRPETMRLQILGVSYYLKGKTTVTSLDYRDVLDRATPDDLVYMDPPYQGVCGNRDSRYATRAICRMCSSMSSPRRWKSSIGAASAIWSLTLIELYAGRSTQATLLGRNDVTIESLYLSPSLADELAHVPIVYRYTRGEQLCLMEGRA